MKPVVGVSTCLDERGRWRAEREYVYLDRAYAHAVERAGALALLLPAQAGARELVGHLDALVIPGGDDFLPPRDRPYAAGVRFEPAPARQLEFDTALLRAARSRGIPVLCICYGMQLLALDGGGHLHYHLPDDDPDAGEHALSEPDERHPVELEADSHLARVLGATRIDVNSLHHQAVSQVGSQLRVVGRSPDDVIEAVEAPEEAFTLGVQWHPEKLDADHGQRLFDALVAATARSAGGRR